MQKLDFTKTLELINRQLKTEDLLKIFDDSLKTNNSNYDGRALTSVIMESKSNYDRIYELLNVKEIINNFGGEPLYKSSFVAELINMFLSRNNTFNIYYNKLVFDFYTFHKIVNKITTASKILFFEKSEESFSDNFENGIIIFEIFADDALKVNTYSKIFNLLDELINALNKSYNPKEETQPAEITLLDSGSNTNIGVKTSAEAAKSMFLAFKEIWDWIINRKHYKSKIENQSLLDNLDVLNKIKEYEESKVLTTDEAKTLVHTIKTRINDLLDLNVIPKTLTEQEIEFSKTDLLLEYKEVKKLKAKNN